MLNIIFTENNINCNKKIKKDKVNISNFGGLLGINSIWKRLELDKIMGKTGITHIIHKLQKNNSIFSRKPL